MYQSEQINELAKALSLAQAKFTPAIKDGMNPHFKNRFASLESIWESCRKGLADNGLCIFQTTVFEDGKSVLKTTLAHSSGQWISGLLPIVSERPGPQGIGAAITYMRRYALSAILGVVSEDDDDGERATQRPAHPQTTSFSGEPPVKKLPGPIAPLGSKTGKPLSNFEFDELDEYISNISKPDYVTKPGVKEFLVAAKARLKELETSPPWERALDPSFPHP